MAESLPIDADTIQDDLARHFNAGRRLVVASPCPCQPGDTLEQVWVGNTALPHPFVVVRQATREEYIQHHPWTHPDLLPGDRYFYELTTD